MVLDTMVFAYALLGVSAHRDEALGCLEQADVITVPDSLRAELGNVVWQWVRHRGVAPETALAVLADAEALFDHVVGSERLWEHALALAIEAGHPFYDALFVAAAEAEGSRVITFDQGLCRAFPGLTVTPRAFLEGA
jgi:predicted nucleic acid-binding protein